MRTPALSLLLFLSISGCSFLSQQPDGDPVRGLRRAVDGVLSDSLFIPASASVKIVSAETGEVLYDRNSARLMRPASNMKLLTTAAALTQVGPSYAFRTLLAVDATPFGPLSGNVYLKGFGDPDLRDTDLRVAVLDPEVQRLPRRGEIDLPDAPVRLAEVVRIIGVVDGDGRPAQPSRFSHGSSVGK